MHVRRVIPLIRAFRYQIQPAYGPPILPIGSDIVIQERLVLNDKEAVHFMPNMMGSLAMYRLRSK